MSQRTLADPAGDQPILSVRAEVERFVPPDSAELNATIEIVRSSKEDALRAAGVAVESVRSELRRHGAVVNDVTSLREPLRWTTRRVTATPVFQTGSTAADRFTGTAQLTIYVRDFDLLEPLEDLEASIGGFRITWVQWQVDSDNPAWGELRADAIQAAIAKGRDYASALDSHLLAVEHVADVGLLGIDSGARMRAGVAMGASGGGSGPNLDPVPQSISSGVEARFRIAPVPLS